MKLASLLCKEVSDIDMEEVKILPKRAVLTGDYDKEADVLYVSFGEPKPAVGADLGDGVMLLYDEVRKGVVGITFIGLRERLQRELGANDQAPKHLPRSPGRYKTGRYLAIS